MRRKASRSTGFVRSIEARWMSVFSGSLVCPLTQGDINATVAGASSQDQGSCDVRFVPPQQVRRVVFVDRRHPRSPR